MFEMFTRHTRAFVRGSLLLPSVFLAGSLLSQDAMAQQWNLVGGSTVTTASAAYTNLVKDNTGNYYLSYYGAGLTQGSVQKFNGTSWSHLGTQGVSPGFATYNGLGVTASGDVYYSFQDGSNSNKLSVKKYTAAGNTWSDAGVAISSGVVNYQNLRIIPSTNYPIVTFSSSGLRAMRYNGSSWSDVGALPIATGAGVLHSMAIGSNDTVYVAVQVGTAYSVYKNHVQAGSSAPWELVGAAGFTSGGSSNQFTVSLAIDGSNNLYMAYRALATPDAGKIAVYKFDGSSWAPLGNQLFSASNVEHISIAVTPSGVPTVAFRENNPTDKTLVYTLSGSTWTSLGIPSANLGNYNALMLDNGIPVVAFCDGTGVNGGAVTVKKFEPPVSAGSITVSTQNNVPATITTNGGTLQTTAAILPATVNQNVTWSIVPGTGSATISATGLVTAQANGTVWAKAVSVVNTALKDSLQVTISNQTIQVTSITVSTQNNIPATITTNAGTLQTIATILPANATNQAVTWSIVPGTGSATISAAGLVTAQANGTVWAKAVSAANTAIMDSLQVTISNQTVPVTSITISTQNNIPATITTNAGTLQTIATILPANATNQAVTWSIVPGTGSATISATGLVTAQANGTVWAKAVSVANTAIRDSLQVIISNQGATGISDAMKQAGLQLYPNPVQDKLTLKMAKAHHPALNITLTDIQGKTVLQDTLVSDMLQLDVQKLPAGFYILRIAGEHIYIEQKVVKK